jgi:hypothetical protein
MRSAWLFDERLNPETCPDENTILTDSWLNFIAGRENSGKGTQAAINAEIRDKLAELCQRIEDLLEERKQFCLELERLAQNSPETDVPDTFPFGFMPEERTLKYSLESATNRIESQTGIAAVKADTSNRMPMTRFLRAFTRSFKTGRT